MNKPLSTEALIRFLHPTLVDIYLEADKRWAEKYHHLPKPFITCTYRSNEIQEKLYKMGRSIPGNIVTNARSGQSPHNYNPSFAFDIAFRIKNGNLDWSDHLFIKFASIISEIDTSCSILWGGSFESIKDCPHFERNGWKNMIALSHSLNI